MRKGRGTEERDIDLYSCCSNNPVLFESRIEAKPIFLKMFSKTRIFKELYNEVEVTPNVNDVKANKEKKVRTISERYDVIM